MTETTDNTARRRKFAITGGTGFVGKALAAQLLADGHAVVLIARHRRQDTPAGADIRTSGLDDPSSLAAALAGCDGVAHLAGINREIGPQTYQRVHVQGTANVVAAAKRAGVKRIAMLSFLRARPNCGSPYHESKFAAEEIVRASGIAYTILKSGVIFGRGDHLLDHLSHALFTVPLFATVGFRQPPLRPIAVRDVAAILRAGLFDPRLMNRTVAILGPERLSMRQIVKRVAAACGRRSIVVPMPVAFHRLLGVIVEATMEVPLVSRAQVQMLSEGLCDPAPLPIDALPANLAPATPFSIEEIRRGLPDPGPFRREHFALGAEAT